MSSESDLPYDIIVQIIDNVGENNDINLIKKLALVSHSFHQICSKHLFATVDLYDYLAMRHASSKNGFVKLLKRRPEVAKYIRNLTYRVENDGRLPYDSPSPYYDDNRLSPFLPDALRTIPFLNCLTITAPESRSVDWNTVNSSLASAFLHLMHLSTINHIVLISIENFPLSSFTSSVNLRRLDIFYLNLEEDDSPENVVLSETMPKIREFRTTGSTLLTTKLLHAERPDGQPAFNFMDLRQLSLSSACFEDDMNLRYLLQNAKLLEKLHLSVGPFMSFLGLHDMLFPIARTLKVLDLTVSLSSDPQPIGGLYEELEAMAGHDNNLEVLSCELVADAGNETEELIGPIFLEMEQILVKPGWSALRQVSFKVSIAGWRRDGEELCMELQILPDIFLSHLPKLESVAFNYECNVDNTIEYDSRLL